MVDERFWQDFFEQAVAVVRPIACLPRALPDPQFYRSVKVIAAGKGASAMASVLEACWPDEDFTGVIVCPYGYLDKVNGQLETLEAAHPVPDQNSINAAKKALGVATTVEPGDLLLVLLSGGASALLCAPSAGITLQEKQQITAGLLAAGAPIDELNQVRSHYSKIKAGGLLAHVVAGATIVTLAISDVVGDEPAQIGSGPTCWSPSSEPVVQDILRKYSIEAPRGHIPPLEKPTASSEFKIIANADVMLTEAANWLVERGFAVVDLGSVETGIARDVAKLHAHRISERVKAKPARKAAFLSGGELTVEVKGSGQGGPNQEYLVALMSKLEPGRYAGFAADTDGCDGVGGAAGAFFDQVTHATAQQNEGYTKCLENNDSCNFFNNLSSLLKVKPTLTNVNDLRVVLYDPGKFA